LGSRREAAGLESIKDALVRDARHQSHWTGISPITRFESLGEIARAVAFPLSGEPSDRPTRPIGCPPPFPRTGS